MASPNPQQYNFEPSKASVNIPAQGPVPYPTHGPVTYPTQGPVPYPTQGPVPCPTQGPVTYPTQGPVPYPTQGVFMEHPPPYPGQAWVPSSEMAQPNGPATAQPQGAPIIFQSPPQQVVQLVTVMQQPLRTPDPVNINCPSCHEAVITKTKKKPGAYAWSIVGIIFITGFFFILPWLFCWIPLCIPSCKDTHHKCPNCKRHLYTHSPM